MKNVPNVLAKARSLLRAGILSSALLGLHTAAQAQCTTISPISGPSMLCVGSYAYFSATPEGGTWSSSNPAVVNSSSLAISPGTATITYTYPGGCGASYVTKDVTVNALPGLITATAGFCAPEFGINTTPVRLLTSEAGIQYALTKAPLFTSIFYPVDTVIGTGGAASFSYIPAHTSADFYRVEAYSPASGCTRVVTDAFQTRWLSSPNILSSPTGCAGTQSTMMFPGLTYNAPGDPFGSPPYPTFSVIVADTTILRSNNTGIIMDYLSAGSTPVYVISSDGCADTAIITVNPANNAGFSINDTTQIITGNSFEFTPALVHPAMTHSWTLGDGTNTTDDTVSHSYAASAVYNVMHTTTMSGCNLPDTVIKKVYVFAADAAIFPIEGNSTVCEGATMPMANVTAGGSWSSANTAVGTIDAATGVFSGLSAGTTTVSYTVGPDAVTKEITVNAMPVISGTPTVCVGATTTLNSSVAGSTWSHNFATFVASVNPTTGVVTGRQVGTAIIYCQKDGCVASAIVTVSGVTAVSGTNVVCVGSGVTYTNGTPGGTWTSSNTGIATVGSSSGLITGVSAGTATITYTISGECPASTTRAITVRALPTVTGTLNVCVGRTTTLTNTAGASTWSSSNTAVATVGASSGIVSGVSIGTAIITCVRNSCPATVVVTVNGVAPISGPSGVCVGRTITLASATSGGTWSSSNTAVATVGSAGIVNGMAVGSATITYTAGGCFVTAPVTVSSLSATISGVTPICVGTTRTLTHATSGGSWSSSDPSVATVGTATGVVTGVAAGSATITYTVGSCYATAAVSVIAPLAGISGAGVVCTGSTIALGNTTAGGIWASSNASVATVGSATGVVSGISAGTAVITYAVGTCSTTTVVTVNAAPAAITGTTGIICFGATQSLSSSTAGGIWSSSDVAIATVGAASGIATGVGAGNATITYTVGGCYTTASVAVFPDLGPITGATTLCAGSASTLVAAFPFGNWSSSNPAVATVGAATGIVTGVSAGTALISNTVFVCAVATTVTVNALPAAIGGVGPVCTGSTITLTNATGGGSWSSSNTAVAGVGAATGIVDGVSAGTATISYSVSGCHAAATVTVNAAPAISGADAVCAGNTIALAATIEGGTWAGSNASVATIDVAGVVTAISAGTATITYAVPSGCIATAVITVHALPAAIAGIGAVCAGNAITLTNATGGGTWSSSNTAIATIGASTGSLSGISEGTATVSYTISATGCYATATVTISPAVAAITGTAAVCDGAGATLACSTTGGTWSSSNTSVATINSGTGLVASVDPGTTTISYRVNAGCANTRVFTVNVQPGTISGSPLVIFSTTLGCSPSGGAWSSSNTSKATVNSSGVVTATGIGSAVISYHLGSCYSTKSVFCVGLDFGFKPAAPQATEPEMVTIAKFGLFPNPSSGIFTVEAPVAGTLAVFTADGRQVQQYSINAAANTITLPAQLAAGTYICRFIGADGSSEMTRLIYQP